MRKSFAMICLLLSLHFVSAQFPTDVHSQYKFKYTTIDNGLSNDIVYGISEDKHGYIWVATRLGLNRLSGTEIKNYYHDPEDPNSLPSHWVYVVFCDSQGTLWIGTDNGLCTYHEGLDAFIQFNHARLETGISFYDITEDGAGNIWFGTQNGLFKYNIKNDDFVGLERKNAAILSSAVYRILNDADTLLWLSLYPKGLCSYNTRLDSIITYPGRTDSGHDFNDQRIEKIFKDKKGDFWFGTFSDGAYKYSLADSSFTRYVIDEENPYSARVRVFFEDNTGKFFVGTRAGLYSYDESTDRFYIYASLTHDFSKLTANSILSSYRDHNMGLWLGTFYGGVNYTNFENNPFTTYTTKENNTYFLNHPNIFGMDEDKEGNTYIGTEGGVNILDAKTSTFTYLQNEPGNNNSLSYNDVKSIAITSNGDFWAGTNLGGLNFYSKRDKKYTVFRHIPGDPNSLPYNSIYYIFLDSNEDIYVLSTLDRENEPSTLSILRNGKTSFENYQNEFSYGIVEGPNENIYIGCQFGFCKYSKKEKNFIFYRNDSLIGNIVSTIYLDRLGTIWIGSRKGLIRYNFETKVYTSYQEKISYSAHDVCGILCDDQDNLWVSTNSGLFELVGAITKPIDSVSVRHFNKDDGLPSKGFFYNASFKNRKGEMFFGGRNGFVRFDPKKIADSRFHPRIAISGLIIDGKIVRAGDVIEGEVILTESIINTNQISLNHKIKAFTLKFDALYFANPDKNGFKYMLENYDSDWQYSNNYNNYVTYANLPPGNYTFRIYATNNDVVVSEEPKILRIRILPPFWETWLFRISIILSFIVLGYFIYKSRIKKFEIKERILKDAVNIRTKELNKSNKELKEQKYEVLSQNEEIQAQNEELFTQREVIEKNQEHLEELVVERTKKLEIAKNRAEESDRLKSAFLANMSHEIRTPLNAIIGFVDILNSEDVDEAEAIRFHEIIKNNGYILLQLINDIIDLSKIEAGQLELFKGEVELNKILMDLYYTYNESLKNNAEKSGVNIKQLDEVGSKVIIKTDPVRLEQILNNLLSNAVKYTKKGTIEFGIKEIVENDKIVLFVRDTGIGIESKYHKRIFDRFIKVDDDKSSFYPGAGLGLAITKQLVEKLGGKIEMDSDPGKGSEFRCILPHTSLKETSMASKGKSYSNRKTPVWKNKVFLIVDDEDTNLLVLEKILAGTGAKILSAAEGHEAVSVFSKHKKEIDVVLLDIKMPNMDGFEALNAIREIDANSIVIAQTAYALANEERSIRKAGFNDYISKPIVPRDLYNLIDKNIPASKG